MGVRGMGWGRAMAPVGAAAAIAGLGACGLLNGLAEFERVDAEEPTGGSGGSEGSGGSGGAVGSGGSGGVSTTTGGSTACDNLLYCGNMNDSASCMGCAIHGECGDEYAACMSNSSCVAYMACIDSCGMNSICTFNCGDSYPTGISQYHAVAACVICDQCPISCGDAAWCHGE